MKIKSLLLETEKPGNYLTYEQYEDLKLRYDFAFKNSKKGRILEIGAGFCVGRPIISQNKRTVVETDITLEGLTLAKKNYKNLFAVRCNAHSLPFSDNSFDTVIALGTVIYLDFNIFIKECLRVLKKKGKFIFNIANMEHPEFKKPAVGKNFLPLSEIISRLKDRFLIEVYGRKTVSFSFFKKTALTLLYLLPCGRYIKEFFVRFFMKSVKLDSELKISEPVKNDLIKIDLSSDSIKDFIVFYFVCLKK